MIVLGFRVYCMYVCCYTASAASHIARFIIALPTTVLHVDPYASKIRNDFVRKGLSARTFITVNKSNELLCDVIHGGDIPQNQGKLFHVGRILSLISNHTKEDVLLYFLNGYLKQYITTTLNDLILDCFGKDRLQSLELFQSAPSKLDHQLQL